jgi:hypothetical protein
MIAVSAEDVAKVAARAGVAPDHPIMVAAYDADFEAALEDAVLGGSAGTKRLLGGRGGHSLTKKDLEAAKVRADAIGESGEALLDAWLTAELAAGRIVNYVWSSRLNAVSPYDFQVTLLGGRQRLIDAKSTSGRFGNAIHISGAEIVEACGPIDYVVARVYALGPNGGTLRFSDPINSFAACVRAAHDAGMPKGVRADAFTVEVAALRWGAEIQVPWPDPDES